VSAPPPIRLVRPDARFRATFLAGMRQLQSEGLPWWVGGDLATVEDDFEGFVAKKLADATRRTAALVPATHYWAIEGEAFAGRITIRHELNDALRRMGGHVGYDTVPSFRGRGVATAMLRLALPLARGLGLAEVLLTCDDDNAASIRVIEKNGGVLRDTRRIDEGATPKRYYVVPTG